MTKILVRLAAVLTVALWRERLFQHCRSDRVDRRRHLRSDGSRPDRQRRRPTPDGTTPDLAEHSRPPTGTTSTPDDQQRRRRRFAGRRRARAEYSADALRGGTEAAAAAAAAASAADQPRRAAPCAAADRHRATAARRPPMPRRADDAMPRRRSGAGSAAAAPRRPPHAGQPHRRLPPQGRNRPCQPCRAAARARQPMVDPSDAALGFKPSTAPPLDPSVVAIRAPRRSSRIISRPLRAGVATGDRAAGCRPPRLARVSARAGGSRRPER